MEKKDYIANINGEFVVITAFNKADAFMTARLMGYNGKTRDIRQY